MMEPKILPYALSPDSFHFLASLLNWKDGRQAPHFLRTIGFAGLQVIFVTVIGHGVPHLENIGLNQIEIPLALLSGPLCGAFLQPIFGSWSDRIKCRWGRRKPFILTGSLLLILSLLSLAWATSISGLFVSSSASQSTRRQSLVAVTMLSIMTLWVAVQPVQIGLRTLITEDCSESEQSKANAWASTHINLAAALANLAAFMRLIPSKGSKSVFQGLSLLASLVLIIAVGISCVSIEEKTADSPIGSNTVRASHSNTLRVAWRLLVLKPSQIRTVYLVQFFAWLGWFPFLYYAVTYVKSLRRTELYQGLTLNNDTLGAESRVGSLALLAISVVALLASMTLPVMVSRKMTTLRQLWIMAQGLFGLTMLSASVTYSSVGVILLFSMVGLSWAASVWIPFVLLGEEISCQTRTEEATASLASMQEYEDDQEEKGYDREELINRGDGDLPSQPGLIYGMHNMSIAFPQILVNVGMGIFSVSSAKGDHWGGTLEEDKHLAWVLRLGGIFGLVAMYLATSVREVRRGSDENPI